MSLQEYARKRDFDKTPEPKPGEEVKSGRHGGRFFVQRHNATRLHYDFRLEIDGTLKSWAVPKGPTLDPDARHLAMMVEDHPLDYGDFEGNIPKGEYGGGSVMLWDRGTFDLIGEEDGLAQIARGDLKFTLHGEKLSGSFAIVHMKNRGKGNEWLIIKKKDESAKPGWDVEAFAQSVKTGRTQEEIAGDLPAHKKKPAGKKKTPSRRIAAKLDEIPGAVPAEMPGFFAPMGAELAEQAPRGKDWIFEVKWDGVRALCYIDAGEVAMYTRNNNRCDRQYPELQVLPHYLAAERAILDGEIAILDERGVSHFELIQPRIHNQDANAVAKMAQKNPAHFFAFDLLYLDGYDLRQTPLVERKKMLQKILKPHNLIRISEHFEAGEELLEAARQNGLEGLIAKCSTSVYESRRSRNWLKLKLTNEQEFVIGGFLPGEREYFGSLALGFYENGKLHYAGNVGTGFNARNAAALWQDLEPLIRTKTPFDVSSKMPKGTVFVKPELVAQIKFANWTNDRRLRAPVYLGRRDDKSAKEVRREVVEFLPADRKEATVELDGHSLKLTNLDKVYYPEDGYRKRDVLNYYYAVGPMLLPYLKDRPLSLKRYPNGIHEEFFFQKNTPENYPSWLRTESIPSNGKAIRYVLAEDMASLVYLTNLGCIDQNPWMSRVGSLECPDFILIDLDPQECEYTKIVEAALLVKEKLDAIGLTGYPKTTGGDGMHIYIPVEPRYTYDAVRSFAEVIARMVAAERPGLFTTPRSVAAREKNRVYFDYLQIAESKTISAPYVVRAYPGAHVSTPLEWSEITPKLHPSQFTIANVRERFAAKGDLFEGVLKKPQQLEKAFPKLQKLVSKGS